MAEPASTSGAGLVAVAVVLFGPMAGEYAVIVMSALAGALWALAGRSTTTRLEGALLVARLVLTAVVLTAGVAWVLEQRHQIPAHQVLAPVAFCIGAIGHRWPALIKWAYQSLAKRFST